MFEQSMTSSWYLRQSHSHNPWTFWQADYSAFSHIQEEDRYPEGELHVLYECFCSHLNLDLGRDLIYVWSLLFQSIVEILLRSIEIIKEKCQFLPNCVCLEANMNISHAVPVSSQVPVFLDKVYVSVWLLVCRDFSAVRQSHPKCVCLTATMLECCLMQLHFCKINTISYMPDKSEHWSQ